MCVPREADALTSPALSAVAPVCSAAAPPLPGPTPADAGDAAPPIDAAPLDAGPRDASPTDSATDAPDGGG